MADTGDRRGSTPANNLWRLSGLGTELAAGIVGMALFGLLLDWWLGTRPWLTVSGAVLGVIGGGYNFLKQATRVSRAAAEQYKREHPGGPDRPVVEGKRDWEKHFPGAMRSEPVQEGEAPTLEELEEQWGGGGSAADEDDPDRR